MVKHFTEIRTRRLLHALADTVWGVYLNDELIAERLTVIDEAYAAELVRVHKLTKATADSARLEKLRGKHGDWGREQGYPPQQNETEAA